MGNQGVGRGWPGRGGRRVAGEGRTEDARAERGALPEGTICAGERLVRLVDGCIVRAAAPRFTSFCLCDVPGPLCAFLETEWQHSSRETEREVNAKRG